MLRAIKQIFTPTMRKEKVRLHFQCRNEIPTVLDLYIQLLIIIEKYFVLAFVDLRWYDDNLVCEGLKSRIVHHKS